MSDRPIDPDDGEALLQVQQSARLRAIEDPNVPTLLINRVVLCAVARAVLPEGYVAVPVEAVEQVIRECTAPDHKFYNFVDGEWLRGYMRSLLPEHIRAIIDASLLSETEATQ
jgi:hypothetical protein